MTSKTSPRPDKVTVWCSRAEKALIQEAAKRDGMAVSQWIRIRAIERAIRSTTRVTMTGPAEIKAC